MLLKSVIPFTAVAALALPASSFATEYQALKGTYVGNYQLTMNVLWPDDNGGPGTPFVLGRSMSHAYWQWDFDNNLLTWGGGRHNTIMDVTPAFQPYHLEQLANADKVAETEPNIRHESEITIPFTNHGDGTYSVDYAHKIHLVLAELVNAPIGAGELKNQTDSVFYFPRKVRVSGSTIDFFVPRGFLGGPASEAWGYTVIVTGADLEQAGPPVPGSRQRAPMMTMGVAKGMLTALRQGRPGPRIVESGELQDLGA